MVDHSVNRCCGNDGVTEIIAELFEVDICGNDCRGFAVPAIDNLVKETGVGGIMLFQAIEADFVDEQYFRGEKRLKLFIQAIVRPACEKFLEHSGGGNVTAAVVLPATDEEERLGDMAFAGAGVAGEDKALLALSKLQGSQFHNLSFVDVFLKVKIEVGEEFPVGQFGFFDSPFGPPLRPGIVFQAEQALEKFCNRGGLGGGPAKFIVEDGGNPL
jgi:hypothetical protein